MTAIRFAFMMVLSFAGSAQALADLIIQESFDYPFNSILTQTNGGLGFAGGWTAGARNTGFSAWRISDGSLSFDDLVGVGNSVTSVSLVNGLAGAGRNTATSFHGASSQVSYMSFLINRRSTDGAFGGFGGIYVGSNSTENDAKLFVGLGGSSNNWLIENLGGGGAAISNTTSILNQTTLLVVKMETLVGNDRFTLYVNPTTETEPLTGFVKNDLNLNIANRITMYQSGAFTIDEIRVGETFADVTSVPEPSSLMLAGIMLTGFALRRKARLRAASAWWARRHSL